MNKVETDAEKIARLERDLAECYRLSGADPDGDEDWRLAPRAVEEVRRMRQELDESVELVGLLDVNDSRY
jgi:hypothetical protein